MEKLTAHEKAIITYEILQRRKAKREYMKNKISCDYAADSYKKAYRKYKNANSHGYVQKKWNF